MLVGADGAAKPIGGTGQTDGFVKVQRNARCLVVEIAVAPCFSRGLGCRFDAVEAGADFGGKQEVGIAVRAGVTLFDSGRAGASFYDPQRHRAVVMPPAGVGGAEGIGLPAPVGIDRGRAANRRFGHAALQATQKMAAGLAEVSVL